LIDDYDIVNFLRTNYLNAQLSDGTALIMDYDTKQNNALDFQDFCYIILP